MKPVKTNILEEYKSHYDRPSQMAARGPNPARRPYLFVPLSTPIYIEIHKAMVIIWPSDTYL